MADASPTFGDLLWMFFLIWIFITFVTPYMKYQSLKNARASLIRALERRLGAKVITMIHRQEKISLLGIPIYRFIDIEDSEQVLRAIRSTPPETPIALILHTPGGLLLAASQIALALKRHPAKKIVIIPHYAMSGGTLISLAADEIWMDPDAVLGPVDPQLTTQQGQYPAPSIINAVKQKGTDKVSDQTLILADIAQKALNQTKQLVTKLLQGKLNQQQIQKAIQKLVEGTYTHDWPITAEDLQEIGLKVKTQLPQEVYQLMELYPQEKPARPTVEYIPGPIPTPTHPTKHTNQRK